MDAMPAKPSSTATTTEQTLYIKGSLRYTKHGLIALFVWLLWGDFCFQLMETVVPSTMPVKLHALDAPNWLLALIATVIPNTLTILVNPVASFRSDRYRSRYGRRIPFLIGITPFLVLFLILLGHSESIGRFLHAHVFNGGSVNENTVIIGVLGVLMVCFQFFNCFINSIYYYLFADVVPEALLGRFMSLFRMVSITAASLYSLFIFKYANAHMGLIFTAAGILYLIAFALMCWKVKEGTYPEPPANIGGSPGIRAATKTYFQECFSKRISWYFFLGNSCFAMTWALASYQVLLANSVGITNETYGSIEGTLGLISAALLIPFGLMVDRTHPLNLMRWAGLALLCIQPLWLIFLFVDFSPEHAMWMTVAIRAIALPALLLYGLAEFPMWVKFLERERFGQYCSANALLRSTITIASSLFVGLALDLLVHVAPNKDFVYRFVPIFTGLALVGCLIFLHLLRREWRRTGGHPGSQMP